MLLLTPTYALAPTLEITII